MRLHILRRAAPALVVAGALLFTLMPAAALAHERRAIGDYSFLVGFNVEPAIQGQVNGAQLTVTVPDDNNRPVLGLQNTLTATVYYGSEAGKQFPLAPVRDRKS